MGGASAGAASAGASDATGAAACPRRDRTSFRSSCARSSRIACRTPSSSPRRAAGLELDLGQPQQPGDRSLRDVDVLDSAEGDRAMRPVQDAAVDSDFILPDAILKSPPVEEQPGRHEQDQQDRADQRRLQSAGNGEIADAGIAARHASHRAPKTRQQEEGMEMFRRTDRRIVRRSRFEHVRG